MTMSYTEKAEGALEKAEEWANRDGVADAKFRMDMIQRNLTHAQVFATLAVADRLDAILGHFEERTIAVEAVRE
jgi:hypothetical protein